jgi:hypothetical protein
MPAAKRFKLKSETVLERLQSDWKTSKVIGGFASW